MTTNWAGNISYAAAQVARPHTVAEVQELVAGADRVRALGSGHTFNDLPDTDGVLVTLADVPFEPVLDTEQRQVTIGAGARYGDLAGFLEPAGWALANLASLPHISVVGAVMTGTHGSGVGNPSMAAAVAGLEIVGHDGSLRWVRRGDPDFDGSVVSLGALGVVTRVTLDVEPSYAVRQDVLLGLTFATLTERFDELAGSAYSVSFFTDWSGEDLRSVWVKSRDLDRVPSMPGTVPAMAPVHPAVDGDTRGVTEQGGVAGRWADRLPHFRMEFTPSSGAELQSEYFVPRRHAVAAIAALRGLGPQLTHLVIASEIRTIAADRLWLSPSEGEDAVAFHFTWQPDTAAVYAVLPAIETALEPFAGRPHWGKCFVTPAGRLAELYPRWADFADLRGRLDPDGTFGNRFLAEVLGH